MVKGRIRRHQVLPRERRRTGLQGKVLHDHCFLEYSDSDPFHFDPWIRFAEKRIRMRIWFRPKIERIPTFFASDYPEKYCYVIL